MSYARISALFLSLLVFICPTDHIIADDAPAKASGHLDGKWVQFKNEKYGYELDLPGNWEINTSIDYPADDPEPGTSASAVFYAPPEPGKEKTTVYAEGGEIFITVKPERSWVRRGPDDRFFYVTVIPIPVEFSFKQWWLDHRHVIDHKYDIHFPEDQAPTGKAIINGRDERGSVGFHLSFHWMDNFVYILYYRTNAGIENDYDLRRVFESFKPHPNRELLEWREYNHETGFSVQVPVMASVAERGIEGAVFRNNCQCEVLYGMCGFRLDMRVIKNPERLSIPAWYGAKLSKLDSHWRSHLGEDLEVVKVGDYEGYRAEGFGGDSSVWSYYIAMNDKIVAFSFDDYPIENDPENTRNLKIYGRILSSFRLLTRNR
ncbi:MAG: hypothetical protein ACNS63_05430 [Candidatus Nitrospinota bacterium M3_3B_026]